MLDIIQVNYKYTRNAFMANKFLNEIQQHDLIACDFEVAIKYTEAELQAFKNELATDPPKLRRIELESKLAATALDHASHCRITHCSIATNDHTAYVFIIDNQKLQDLILNFLVTTQIKQVWHRASFDFRHIYYNTGRIPINYEDTQIFAKCILNHVDTYKANTGLKELVQCYGQWGISSDNFTVDRMYDEHVIKYAATDACATYYLYEAILQHCEQANDITIPS